MMLTRTLIILAFISTSLALPAQPLRIRSDVWMPFNGESASAPAPGYVLELLREVFGADALDYQTQPWQAALVACRAGEIDAVIGANAKEAAELVHGAECISEVKYALFLKKTTPFTFESYASLKGHKLGVVAGYSYWDHLDEMIQRAPDTMVFLDPEHPADDGLKRLHEGTIELLAEALPVFFWTAKKLGLDAHEYRMTALQPGDPIYVAFRPGEQGQRWAEQLDEGIRRLRANGKLGAILNRYGLSDWK